MSEAPGARFRASLARSVAPAPTRLSALDASFLEVETPAAHMHVGWVAHFRARDGRRAPSFEELREHIAGRLGAAPRYRQRLVSIPLGVHDPVWADDPDFAIERHVLRAESSDVGVIADAVMSCPLARDRPLWEMWIAEDPDGGGFAMVGKAHHCMVDGLAAIELGMALLDARPDSPRERPATYETRPTPALVPLIAQALLDRVGQQLDVARGGLGLLRSPTRLLAAPSEITRVGRALVHAIVPFAPASALNRPSSPSRHLAILRRPLDDLRRIKQRHHTTVNDVLLAAVAGGLRSFLAERGEAVADLKSMVPVSVRGDGSTGALGNRISFLFTELPCAEPDPLARLEKINAVTVQRKAAHEAESSDAALQALAHVPRTLQRAASHLVASPRAFNLVVSNIPGPPEPLYMLGCELTRAYPVVPLAEGHALSIGMTTIQGEACLGLYADRQALPDVDRLAGHVDSAIDELLELSR
jgi:diacylglycerol O-acyltransferase / wax synthase